MTTHVNTIVVGGGQAGLAVSYFLTSTARIIPCSSKRTCPPTLGAIIAGIPSPSTRRAGNRGCPACTTAKTTPTASCRVTNGAARRLRDPGPSGSYPFRSVVEG